MVTKYGAALLAILIVTSKCAPLQPNLPKSQPPIPSRATNLIARGNKCGDSSFENQTSAASPKTKDCEKIVANFKGGGTWTISDKDGQRELVSSDTCAFGVSVKAYPPDSLCEVGNKDIIDLIGFSIDHFESKNKVGAKGFMWCGNCWTAWGLY